MIDDLAFIVLVEVELQQRAVGSRLHRYCTLVVSVIKVTFCGHTWVCFQDGFRFMHIVRVMSAEVKEVVMDAPPEGRKSRKRSGKRAGRKTRVAEDDATVVTKDEHMNPKVPVPVQASAPASVAVGPKVVIAPPKKKPVKVMLVPKGTPTVAPRSVKHKTFKAKSVKVTIDNTAKTRKSRVDALAKIDGMSDDQIRAAAVQARLSRRETVGKAPIGLLRQMIKDYQIMKGRLQ